MVGEEGVEGEEDGEKEDKAESVDSVDRGAGGGRGGFRNRGVAGREDSAALRSRARRARRGVALAVDEGARLDREVNGRGEAREDVDVEETVDTVEEARLGASMPIVEAGRRGREDGGNGTRGDALV